MEAYADGACRGNPGHAGCGAWLLDSYTQEITALAKQYEGDHETNNVAEYHGLMLALELAEENRVDDLHVFMDSEVVVKQMMGVYRARSARMRALRDECRELARGMYVEYYHLSRHENARADQLANEAIDDEFYY